MIDKPITGAPEKAMSTLWSSLVSDENGATMVEYGVMLALIAVVAAVAVSFFGESVKAKLFDLAVSAFP